MFAFVPSSARSSLFTGPNFEGMLALKLLLTIGLPSLLTFLLKVLVRWCKCARYRQPN